MSLHNTYYIIQGIVLAVFLGIYLHLQQWFLYSQHAENIEEGVLKDIEPKYAFSSLVEMFILLLETVISAESTTKSSKRSKKTKSFKRSKKIKGRIYEANLTKLSESEFRIFCEECYNNDLLSGQYTTEQLMVHEYGRLLSYNNCPHIEKYSTIKLAKCGFYYTGKASTIKCFCCGLSFTSLPIEKTIEEVHRQRSPFCKFVRGEDLSNVPSHHPVSSNGIPFNFPNLFGCSQNNDPKYPDQSNYETRLRSFQQSSLTRPSPEVLAKAGLFLVKAPDLVRCFDCGLGLKDWNEGDDPWIEHARFSPTCQHVRRCKGANFPELVRLAAIEFEQRANIAVSPDVNWLSSAAQLCILAGYPEELVKQAVIVLRTEHGIDPSLATLLAQLRKFKTDAQSGPSSSNGHDTRLIDQLTEDNRRLCNELEELHRQYLCKICLDKECSVVFLPCGHMISCTECAPRLQRCGVCRARIMGTVRTFIS